MPWSGTAFRHLLAGARYDLLDFRYAGRAADNRWNAAGEPTLYLAGDVGVAIAEFARHLAVDRAPALASVAAARTVYRLAVRVERLLDLREPAAWAALSLENAPFCFADKSVARATAQFLRRTTAAQGLLVPSVAFLDDLDRWVLALFLEKLPAESATFIPAVAVEGPLRWAPGAAPLPDRPDQEDRWATAARGRVARHSPVA